VVDRKTIDCLVVLCMIERRACPIFHIFCDVLSLMVYSRCMQINFSIAVLST